MADGCCSRCSDCSECSECCFHGHYAVRSQRSGSGATLMVVGRRVQGSQGVLRVCGARETGAVCVLRSPVQHVWLQSTHRAQPVLCGMRGMPALWHTDSGWSCRVLAMGDDQRRRHRWRHYRTSLAEFPPQVCHCPADPGRVPPRIGAVVWTARVQSPVWPSAAHLSVFYFLFIASRVINTPTPTNRPCA